MSSKLFSVEIERSCLSAMLNYKDEVIDFVPFVSEDHFYFNPHKVIFLTIKNLIMSGANIDIVIVVEKLISIGINKVEDIDILDYIEILQKLDSLNSDSIPEYFKVLQKYFNARQLTSTAARINDFVHKNINKSSQELMTGAEKIFGDKVNEFSSENDPLDLFSGLMEEVENRGNEPKEDGISCPYNNLRRLYGNFLKGGLYVWAAPAKAGKSTLLLDILKKTCNGKTVKGLYLDTELTFEQQRLRLASSLSGVSEYYIRTGKFRKDAEMMKKVRAIWPIVAKLEGSIDHIYIGGKDFQEVVSLIRRWTYKHIHGEQQGVVVFDYLKLSGEKMNDANKEYQIIYDKANKLKELAQELKMPILGAIQTNGDGDIAMSKRVRWIVDMLAIFRRKTNEELQLYGDKFGSHIMCVTESRFQGEDAMGFADLVKFPDGKYHRMFLNFNVNNFNLEECGNATDVVEFLGSNVNLSEEEDQELTPRKNKSVEEFQSKRDYKLKMFDKTPF